MRITTLAALLVGALVAPPLWAAPIEIGKTTEARKATAQLGNQSRALAPPDIVRLGETIETSQGGRAKFLLRDATHFEVGPNSRLVLDRFVYDPDRNAGEVAIRSVKGMLRFMSGGQRSDAYKLRAPQAIVGLRGTILELFVTELEELLVVLVEGATEVCNAAGCVALATPGTFVLVSSPNVMPSSPRNWRESPYNTGAIAAFTWVPRDGTLAIPDQSGPIEPRDIPGAIPLPQPAPTPPASPPPPPLPPEF